MRGSLLDGSVWLASIWLWATLVTALAFVAAVTVYLSLRAIKLIR